MSEDSSDSDRQIRPPAPAKTRGLGPWPLVGILALLIFFSSQVIALLAVVALGATQGQRPESVADWLTANTVAQFGYTLIAEVMVVAMVLFILRLRKLPVSSIGLQRPGKGWVPKAFAGLLVFYVMLFTVSASLLQLLPKLNTEQEQDIGFKAATTQPELALVFLCLVVIVPIGEEVLMRGYLYGGLRAKFNFVLAGLLTSLLFGMAHLGFGSGKPLLWTAGISTFILSLVLVYLREKTGSIWAGVLVHAFNNMIAFLVRFHASLF